MTGSVSVSRRLPCLTAALFTMVGCSDRAPAAPAGGAVLGGRVCVTDFGARGDWNYADKTGADDTLAIQSAIDHAAATAGASKVVVFPPGNYRISSTIRLPNWVRLRGDNGRNTQIHADPAFAGLFMFHANNGTASMFHSRLEELWVRVHGHRGIRAVVKADGWQENDGLSRVVITGFTKYAVEIEFGHGGASSLGITDCEFFADTKAVSDAAGIYVHQISLVSAFMLRVDSTVITGASAATPLAHGIVLGNDTLAARVVHFEFVKHGVLLHGRANAVLDALTGSFSRTDGASLVTLGAEWDGYLTARGLMPNGFRHTLLDRRTGEHRQGNIPELRLPPK